MSEVDEVAQEFGIWKKNSPFLYDLVIAHSLTWPSLTLQWLPGTRTSISTESTVHRLLLGTHTSEDAQDTQNHVIVADVHVPDDTAQHPNKDDTEVGTGSGIKSGAGAVCPVVRIAHEGEVNRARYCPQKPDLLATKAIDGDVYLFDIGKPGKPHRVDPVIRLKGHKDEGYGLAWSPLREGHVLSGSNDALVCLWDTAVASGKSMNATSTYGFHTGTVGDVAWHSTQEQTFASVGDDGKLIIYDSRKPVDSAAVEQVDVQGGDCNCVAFHPTNQHLLATSAGPSIGLFDMRNLKQRLHMLAHHTEDVYQIGWNPHHETILASSAGDRRVMLWDLSAIGDEQAREDAEDGPPELLFVHGGHTAKISDVSWNPNPGSDWMLASTADDNFLQVYTPAASALMG